MSKFLHYHPDILIINNLEFDHADIFDSIEDIKRAFRLLLRLVPQNGQIVLNADDDNAFALTQHAFTPVQTYGKSTHAQHQIKHCQFDKRSYMTRFEIHTEQKVTKWQLPLLGEFNIFNATAAIITAHSIGCSDSIIQEALSTFQAPKRRLELLTENHQWILFDDFAHHPTAIKATIDTIKKKYPKRQIIACYEPRSNTALSSVFQNQLPLAFEQADVVAIYKAKKQSALEEEKQLQFDQLLDDLRAMNKQAYFFDDSAKIEAFLSNQNHPEIAILMMSQGGFEGIPARLAKQLDQK